MPTDDHSESSEPQDVQGAVLSRIAQSMIIDPALISGDAFSMGARTIKPRESGFFTHLTAEQRTRFDLCFNRVMDDFFNSRKEPGSTKTAVDNFVAQLGD